MVQRFVVRRGSKYGARKTDYNGRVYASQAEALRASTLDQMVEAGLIRWWIGQPVFVLGCPENRYRADFLVVGFDDVWVEDVKGAEPAAFRRQLGLWRRYGPCDLWVVRCDKRRDVVRWSRRCVHGGLRRERGN